MQKSEYIEYWKNESEKDWKRAEILFNNNEFVFAMFCLHLSMEKLSKACWVKNQLENFPPRMHNIIYLLSQSAVLLNESQQKILDELNIFQIEGRYVDYKLKIYKFTTFEYVSKMFEKLKEIKICLLEILQ